jgi:hypothetical protein
MTVGPAHDIAPPGDGLQSRPDAKVVAPTLHYAPKYADLGAAAGGHFSVF